MLPLPLSSHYEKIAAPTLIVCAPGGLLTGSDPIMLGEEGARLAAAIPNARLLTDGGANHYTILFDPDPGVLHQVKQFLSD